MEYESSDKTQSESHKATNFSNGVLCSVGSDSTTAVITNKIQKWNKRDTHETIALGSPCVLIGDDNGLENLAELLEVAAHGFALSLPGQPSDEDFGVSGVSERRIE
ncbi:hypothetical protein V8G54_008418 [Vigna mungo]|uniref:Uncharacterized protein n=1 Tax=Vigna mungo TaxID=3915 RepID=A0AAQ3P566_VIGMU